MYKILAKYIKSIPLHGMKEKDITIHQTSINSEIEKKMTITFFDWVIFFGLSIIWGFSFFFIKKGLEVFPPVDVAAFRMVIAFLAFTPLLFMHRKKLFVRHDKLKLIPLLGLFGNLIPALLFCIAGTKIESALSGIMNSTTPLFALCIGSLFFGVMLTGKKLFGVGIGIIGTLMIVLSNQSISSINLYVLLPLMATISYGLNANLFKYYFQKSDPIVIALLQYFFVGVVCLAYLIYSGAISKIILEPALCWQSLKYLLLLGVFGTAMAQVYFNILTQRTSALFATMTTYVIPFVSIVIGLFIGEKVLPLQIIGLFIILIGIYIGSKN